jgi:hypothetical protein
MTMKARPHSTTTWQSAWVCSLRVACAIVVGLVAVAVGNAADDLAKAPGIYETDPYGTAKRVTDDKLYTFEKDVRSHLSRKDAPTEIIVFATSPPIEMYMNLRGDPHVIREMLTISLYGDRGDLTWFDEYGERHGERKLSASQIQTIRNFIADNKVDNQPPLDATRTVNRTERVVIHGTEHVYVHLGRKSARRVRINNPPVKGESDYPADDPSWKYRKIVDFFNGLKPADNVAAPKLLPDPRYGGGCGRKWMRRPNA